MSPRLIRVLGVDPGLTRTGWAIVAAHGHHYQLIQAAVIAPRAADGSDDLPARLADGYTRFRDVLDTLRPDLIALEDVFTTPRFPASALKMAHLRGVLCLAAAQARVPLISLTATTVKQRLTGNGRASKEQVQRMAFQLCDVSGVDAPSDLSDAIALAIAGLHQVQYAALGQGMQR
ncbi:MAG: crossover junction endodeoxyribonuclease RuvC [Chloroflexi bacterium]|nr:crossover junction endodeoxyribonuclease RuvC [Chloroflexota bacterium]